MDKIILDEIIETHKAQPVGNGYIDIIVSRDKYEDFVSDLVNNGYQIECISWWEWCSEEKKSEYGYGGPKSYFYDGWFSEIPIEADYIQPNNETNAGNIIAELINIIETKTINFPDETVTFKQNNWLTPAIWLNVPVDWKNKYVS